MRHGQAVAWWALLPLAVRGIAPWSLHLPAGRLGTDTWRRHALKRGVPHRPARRLPRRAQAKASAPAMVPPQEIVRQLRQQGFIERRAAYKALVERVEIRREGKAWKLTIKARPEAGITGLPPVYAGRPLGPGKSADRYNLIRVTLGARQDAR